MCGITGFLTSDTKSADSLRTQATRMGATLTHRGPDAGNAWVDPEAGIALAHRRLSIVDLSETGAQPMTSNCGQLVITYNGEIYNAKEIAKDFPIDLTLKGTSDTEVILEACRLWGVEKTVKRMVGMFALSIWDRQSRELTLVRDRVGIKPLYWCKTDTTFMFGSELKALRQHPKCPSTLDRNAIAGYLRKSYVSAPYSIYKGVQKLEPGKILRIKTNSDPIISEFWSMQEVLKTACNTKNSDSDTQAIAKLDDLVSDAVSSRMIADVPLGAFLSGGVDSSLVVAMMQRHSTKPVKTFSIGFDEKGYNEAVYAADVARHLGTEHTEMYVTAQDALDTIPMLPTMYDEPFADMSQIPTYLVSKMTREHVTVALSGDGGDEVFAGYQRYFDTNKYRKLLNQPAFARHLEAKVIEKLSPSAMSKIQPLLPNVIGKVLTGNKLQRIPPILRDGNLTSLYKRFLTHCEQPSELLLSGEEYEDNVWDYARDTEFPDKFSAMQYIDTLDYLPDDILTKVDRASMAVSLEARVPLLDHRIIEYAWTLPEHMKVRDNNGKWILRNVLYSYVPPKLIDRPKMGFSVPIGAWLKGSLKDWAEDLLSQDSLRNTEIFNPDIVRKRWQEHLSAKINWEYHLWDILSIQAWARAQSNQ